jgi:signal transduction histidine kinase
LVALVKQSVQTTAELLREKGATLTLNAPSDPIMLRADSDRLMQVMLNLISNAAKFVPPQQGLVAVSVHLEGRRVVVQVQDNGPGVPPDQLQLVFEKFRQGGDGLNRPQGTGLGLPISRQIVEHFGGHMWLQSQPGKGACFAFDLPLDFVPDDEATSPTGDHS